MRTKQAPPTDAVRELVPRAMVKQTPKHSTIKATTVWTEQDKQLLRGLDSRQREREEKRLLHNRHAVDRGHHLIRPFYGRHGIGEEMECERCGLKARIQDMSRWLHPIPTGPGMCSGYKEQTRGYKQSRASVLLPKRVAKIEQHNANRSERQHKLKIPTLEELDQPITCEVCGATKSWKETLKILNGICRPGRVGQGGR